MIVGCFGCVDCVDCVVSFSRVVDVIICDRIVLYNYQSIFFHIKI